MGQELTLASNYDYSRTTVILLIFFVSETTFGNRRSDTFRFDFEGKGPVAKIITPENAMDGFAQNKDATSVHLLTGDTFYTNGYSADDIESLLHFSKATLHMCIEIQRIALSFLSVDVMAIKGNCGGPMLKIVNNPQLEYIEFKPNFIKSLKGVAGKPVLVHGNKKLDKAVIQSFSRYPFIDVQENYGECMMPSPLESLRQITSDNCTIFYGPLIVKSTVTSLPLPHVMENKYKWTGCILIENTALDSVKFLRMFKYFSAMTRCQHRIRGNKNLCLTKELDFLHSQFFVSNLQISDNKESCKHACTGGTATDEYLKSIAQCSEIYGDLVISGWKSKSRYVENLRSIKHIMGRLIIANNSGLEKFTYFSNLETISARDGKYPFLIVRNNSDLSDLPMPKLNVNIDVRGNDPRLEATGNPLLTRYVTATAADTTKGVRSSTDVTSAIYSTPKEDMHTSSAEAVHTKLKGYTSTLKKHTEAQTVSPTALLPKKVKGAPNIAGTNQESVDIRMQYLLIVVGAVILFTLAVITSFILFLLFMPGRHSVKLPPLPKLSEESRKILSSLSKEISSKNPIFWSAYDKEVLWEPGRSAAGADTKATGAKSTKSLKALMIPLAANGTLPAKKKLDCDKLLLRRVQEISKYQYVIMVGNGTDVSKIVPRLPNCVGGLSLYIDSKEGATYSYKLVEVYHMSSRTIYHKYEVRNVKKRRKKHIHLLYYEWLEERFPTEFNEILRVLHFCSKKKAICVSNRRKEVFSLLYLIFNIVCAAKQVKMVKIFQFHLRNCNGAPLDREEMLFAFRTVIDWAQETASQLRNDKGMSNWCQIYTKMATFAKSHPNVRFIRHSFLTGDGEVLPKSEEAALNCRRVPFSERCDAVDKHFGLRKRGEVEEIPEIEPDKIIDVPVMTAECKDDNYKEDLGGIKTEKRKKSLEETVIDDINVKTAILSPEQEDLGYRDPAIANKIYIKSETIF
ncbi:hypothetical protein GCK32_004071 [Trichostrongylus colubriformis]|uniref:Receptor L-domain domain-containing protein n=1 Tax=Trichostrongylus colubriformis TaxID=6319 RepID=A0AAN8FNT3_TRICO